MDAPPAAPSSVAELVAEFLSRAGVEATFTYAGTENLRLMEALRQRGVRVVGTSREGGAAFMAEAAGMLTGRPGVCLSTLGPGSTALVNGIASAQLDRAPVVAISGQVSPAREASFTHQVVDHDRLFAPITKWAARMEAGSAGTVMRKALRTATAERPGAVHITMAGDLAAREVSDARVELPPAAAHLGAAPVDHPDLRRALARARRPVLLAGMAAARAGAGARLAALAESTCTPVVVSPMAKGVVPDDHPWYAGVLDMACSQVLWSFLAQADLIVAVGFDGVELIKPWTPAAPVVHVDAVPNTDQIYAAEHELVGSIPATLDALRESGTLGGEWREADVIRHRERLRSGYYEGRVAGRLNPTDVVDALRAALPADTIATTDVGSHKLLMGQGWESSHRHALLMSNGMSSMGFSLPAAIAAALLRPERPVLCTIGDGGLMMVHGELATAAALGLGLLVVVFNDGSLNRIELKQAQLGFPSTATRVAPSDIPALARAMGCDGERVDSVSALTAALAAGTAAGRTRPLVIDAHIDPTQYATQF
jgi:acetolactate synthase-1/2/3 large subunit